MDKATNYNLPITTAAHAKLTKLDRTLIGTPNYLGIAFFWNYEYRHLLRDATPKQRKKVHDKLIAAGLSCGGRSDKHKEIVMKVCEPHTLIRKIR